MVNPFYYFLRKKNLKKYASGIKTGMIPLSAIHSAFILLDSSDDDISSCVSLINVFFHKSGIPAEIFYIDTRSRRERKNGKGTDPASTFRRKDLNLYGRLKKRRLLPLLKKKYDLYIDLTARCDYPVSFLACAMPARFKVGCTGIENNIFDLTVTPPSSSECSSSELFKGITSILSTVN